MSPPPILIRADAGPEIGHGHVRRCAALARALIGKGASIVWLTASPELVPNIGPAAQIAAMPSGADETRWIATAMSGAAALIADWRETDAGRVAALRAARPDVPVILLGDNPVEAEADLIVRQTFDADAKPRTPCELVGPDWLLLASEHAAPPATETPDFAARLLVTMGGGAMGRRHRVAEALAVLPGPDRFALTVIGDLQTDHFAERPWAGLEVLPRAEDMARRMRDADLAVLAAGTTLHEAAAAGLPAISLAVADNQLPRGEALERMGLGRWLGPALDCPPRMLAETIERLAGDRTARAAMRARGPALIDGKGADRCAAEILRLAAAKSKLSLTSSGTIRKA